MSALVRCPQCDSFVKPSAAGADSCPFCESAQSARRARPVQGIVLAAAAIAGASGCSVGDEEAAPVYGVAFDAGIDAGPSDAMPGESDAMPAQSDAMPGPDAMNVAPEE